jgi:hypothetical protein
MRLTWATALTAVVLLAAPFAQATFEITATTCTCAALSWWEGGTSVARHRVVPDHQQAAP